MKIIRKSTKPVSAAKLMMPRRTHLQLSASRVVSFTSVVTLAADSFRQMGVLSDTNQGGMLRQVLVFGKKAENFPPTSCRRAHNPSIHFAIFEFYFIVNKALNHVLSSTTPPCRGIV
jgi:hypothetical protein